MAKKCSECFVRIKRYTYARGIFFSLILMILLMIPIVNLLIIAEIHNQAQKHPKEGTWETYWYDYEEVKVNQEA